VIRLLNGAGKSCKEFTIWKLDEMRRDGREGDGPDTDMMNEYYVKMMHVD